MGRPRFRAPVVGAVLLGVVGSGWATSCSSTALLEPLHGAVVVDAVPRPSPSNGYPLYPGARTTLLVEVRNPTATPARVSEIRSGRSLPTRDACPEGTVTTEALPGPPGTIPGGTSGFYEITATMIPDPDERCQRQTFETPVKAELVPATP